MNQLSPEEHKIILQVRDAVANTHWTKYNYESTCNGKTFRCLTGMINYFTLGDAVLHSSSRPLTSNSRHVLRVSILTRLDHALAELYNYSFAPFLELWNDEAERTKEDVLNLLDHALSTSS